ncbi:hypothetical protein DY000_02016135 [Brassica cretica]|uniref:Uncharacterized protein n=1 Tax=Brassica cretica TaxID=69181 RepID=A0ABQ7CY06_BRACR|nr:hypothetical protein DY000_02016135 [Brassica cretica]
MRSYLDTEVMREPGGSSLDHEIVFGPGGTVLHLPRKDYYWYMFGSRLMPLGSWPLSISYVACSFCRKPLLDLGGFAQTIPALCLIPICFSVDVQHFHKGWPGSKVSWDLIQLAPSHPGASFSAALSLVLSPNRHRTQSITLLEGPGSDFLVVVLGDIFLVGPVS